MARSLRIQFPDAWYHVINRGNISVKRKEMLKEKIRAKRK